MNDLPAKRVLKKRIFVSLSNSEYDLINRLAYEANRSRGNFLHAIITDWCLKNKNAQYDNS